jgi:hypothetical protein
MWHTASCRDGRAEVCSRGDISQLTQSELSEGAECRGIAPPTKITLSDGYELLLGNDTTPEDVQRLLDIAVEIPFATIEDIPESLHRLAQ